MRRESTWDPREKAISKIRKGELGTDQYYCKVGIAILHEATAKWLLVFIVNCKKSIFKFGKLDQL